jgi:hypothetical protein
MSIGSAGSSGPGYPSIHQNILHPSSIVCTLGQNLGLVGLGDGPVEPHLLRGGLDSVLAGDRVGDSDIVHLSSDLRVH